MLKLVKGGEEGEKLRFLVVAKDLTSGMPYYQHLVHLDCSQMYGYGVDQALTHLSRHTFDVVVVDSSISMPDTKDLLREIRTRGVNKECLVVVQGPEESKYKFASWAEQFKVQFFEEFHIADFV